MSADAFSGAARLARVWATAYTRGLPFELGDRRRAEIESDLWEQIDHERRASRPAVLTSFTIVVRLLLGVPADLSWRLEQASPARSVARLLESGRAAFQVASRQAMPTLVGLLGAFYLVVAVLSGLLAGGYTAGERAAWGSIIGGAGVLLVAGLVELKRGARGIAGLLIAAGATLGAAHLWFVFAPPLAALVILSWLLVGARQRRSATLARAWR